MKFRDYKEHGENNIFHIYNRGNRKENIFVDDSDFYFFLLRLKQNLYPEIEKPRRMSVFPENSFSLICYCLLPNHFHLVLRQNKNFTASQLILKLAMSYAMYFNRKYDKIGHVFQGEFKQKLVTDDSYLKWLSAYIHQNPYLHGVVKKSQEYKWSSYGEYINIASIDKMCDVGIIMNFFEKTTDLKEFTESNLEILKLNKSIKGLKGFYYD